MHLEKPPKYADFVSLVSKLDENDQLRPENQVSFYFLRNITIEGIAPFLKYYLYKSDLHCQYSFGEFDNFHQELLDENGPFLQKRPDITVCCLYFENFVKEQEFLNWELDQIYIRLESLFLLLKQKAPFSVAINTFLSPVYLPGGPTFDLSTESHFSKIRALNEKIRSFVRNNKDRFFLVDWERLMGNVGLSNGLDLKMLHMAQAPFSHAFLEEYAIELTKIGRALKGKSKKCLVLDCDNTLWGGVIGEDGIEGIKLDPFDTPGKYYYRFQQSVLRLANQGILICLNSKNNPKDVLDVLKNHPHCLLKEHHIVGFKINWENKVQNLVELAQELNLGIDSFVFVDDSDTECALVRKALEQVTVIQTPKKLYLYQECLLKEGYFDKLTFSQEDQKRTEMYKTDQKRGNAAKNFVNMEEFLSSLELEVFIHPMTEQEIPRVAQLSQKTNQFNLTTKRYSDADIGHFYTDPKIEIYTLSVKDKFGPYGLTGMMVVRIIDKTRAIVDSCLLSCRILGRRLELLFVGYVLEHLTQKYNISEWKAEFFKTKKNEQVEFFWEKFNFEWDQKIEGFKSYHLNSPDLAKIKLNYIKINED